MKTSGLLSGGVQSCIILLQIHFQAEELIKREMLIMLHHDSAYHPTEAQLGITPGSKKTTPSQKSVANQAAHIAYLKDHPLEKYTEEEIENVSF